MAITNEMQKFKFPSWHDVKTANKMFLDRDEYKGYCVNIPVKEDDNFGLYMLIDCQNDSVVGMGSDVIRFAWCNKAGFAVASATYKNCEPGYLMGCTFLVNAAHEMHKFFESFAQKQAFDISGRIEKYNQEHPEPEQTEEQDIESTNPEESER